MEHSFYNALNLLYKGNYAQLKRVWDAHHSWERAWQAAKAGSVLDPLREWERLQKEGIELRLASDEAFPALLKEMPWPPFGLYIKGKLDDDLSRVGIVGTRKCTTVGQGLARRFGSDLAATQVVVVSGLALGIDAAAHQGVVDSKGRTIGVLAGGLDSVYPRQHARLAEEMLAYGGALVSEYAIGTPTIPVRFLERNRIISGLSVGVILIEAPIQSGALATTRFALDQNRTVFVVPGPATSLQYAGSHELIRAGATLVTSATHVLEELGLAGEISSKQAEFDFLDSSQQKIVSALQSAGKPISPDQVSASIGLEIAIINQQLSLLLIQGVIKEQGGNYFI